jgi:hypothetical protein
VDDVSLVTGLPAAATLYTAAESRRSFDARLPEDGGDGALLRLPHSCGVQLETLRVDNSRRRWGKGGSKGRLEGRREGGPEGLPLAAGWGACRHESGGHLAHRDSQALAC